jgi:hypothetical protein
MGRDFVANNSVKQQQQIPKTTANSNQQWSNRNNSSVRTNTERAALAKDSNSTSSADQKILIPSENRKKFNSDVKKSENYLIQTGKGNVFPYIAVKKLSQICNKCYPDNGPSQECTESYKGKCYQTNCKTCNYFGHTTVNCMQSKKVNGGDF